MGQPIRDTPPHQYGLQRQIRWRSCHPPTWCIPITSVFPYLDWTFAVIHKFKVVYHMHQGCLTLQALNTLKIKQLLKITTDNLLNTQVKIKCLSKCYISQIKDIITTLSITNKRYYNNTVYCSLKFCGDDNLRAIQPSTWVVP